MQPRRWRRLRRRRLRRRLRNAAYRGGDDHQLRNLLKAGAAVDAANDMGRTALMLAASNGHEQVALILLKAKADPNKANKEGTAPP